MTDIFGGVTRMPVQMMCPNLRCRKILSCPDEVRGKSVRCTHCQTMIRVPAPKPEPAGAKDKR
jgi:hypothetical protein